MRKILLGTTAVVGLALTGAAAQAQTAPTVRIGGFLNLMANNLSDSQEGRAAGGAVTRDRQNLDFRNELEVQVYVDGKAANGLAYGAVVEIQNDNSSYSGAGDALDIDEAYIYMSSPKLGTIRFGEEDAASYLLQVFVPTVRGLGPDGDFDDIATTGSIWSSITDGNDSTKLIYLSPQFYGFDFGLSYAPNTGEGERSTLGVGSSFTTTAPANQRAWSSFSNDVNAAVRYRGTFAGVGVAASLGARHAEPARAALQAQDLTQYSAGLNLSYMGFTLGGEVTWGQFGAGTTNRAFSTVTALDKGLSDSKNYAVGLTYVTGPISVGAFYALSIRDNTGAFDDRQQTVYGLGAAYTLAPGLELYASYTEVKDKNLVNSGGTATSSPELSSLLVGTRLAF